MTQPDLDVTQRQMLRRWIDLSQELTENETEEQIARELACKKSKVHWFIYTYCREFFPQLQSFWSTAYPKRLRKVGGKYLEDYEHRRDIERGLMEEALRWLGRVAKSYSTGAGWILSELGLGLFWRYMKGRICSWGLDYMRAERYFDLVAKDIRRKGKRGRSWLGGLILTDLANCKLGLGKLGEARDAAEKTRHIYTELFDKRPQDLCLVGEARAVVELHNACSFRGERDKNECQTRNGCYLNGCYFFEKAKGLLDVLDEMAVPDDYGWSKTYQGVGFCSFIKGMIDDDKELLKQASEHMEQSYEKACDIKTDKRQFASAFRDGFSLGGIWRKLIGSSFATDIFIQLQNWEKAEEYDNYNQEARRDFDSFLVELLKRLTKQSPADLPPFKPFYSWELDLKNGLHPRDINSTLAKHIEELKDLGVNIALPLAYISYGDFVTRLQNLPDLQNKISFEEDYDKKLYASKEEELYTKAKSVASNCEFGLLKELAEAKLEGSGERR